MGELRFHDVMGFQTSRMKNVDDEDDDAGLIVMEFMEKRPVPFQQ